MQRIRIPIALILSLTLSFTLRAGTLAVSGASAAPTQSASQIIATPVPTSSLSGQATPEAVTRNRPPLGLTLLLLGFCCLFLLLIGVFILGIVVRRPSQKKDEN
jgi:hypothetical protein